MSQDDKNEPQIDRRDAIKKAIVGAGVAGAVYTAPRIEKLTFRPNYADAQSGALVTRTATLQPEQVVGFAGVRSGAGTATVIGDPATNTITWTITVTALGGTPNAMHVHGPAGIGANAGVVIGLATPTVGGAAITGSTTVTAPQFADFVANLWYINVHSSLFGGGEIRGQVA